LATLEEASGLDRLTPDTVVALDRLAGRGWIDDVYLAGSAALAVHTGHRTVRDLDFMSAANRLTGPERRDLLADLRATDPATAVETARDGYLFARLSGGVAARFFHYPYPLVETEGSVRGVPLASLVDLGLMKLAAIISRGAKRDFADLYVIARRVPLERLLELAPDKFGHVGDFALQALKSWTDWSELEGEPMPELAEPLEWSVVAEWLVGQSREIGRRHVGLAPQESPR
jgi:hypothetical protein